MISRDRISQLTQLRIKLRPLHYLAPAAAALAPGMMAGMRNAGRIPPRCIRRRFRRPGPHFMMFFCSEMTLATVPWCPFISFLESVHTLGHGRGHVLGVVV